MKRKIFLPSFVYNLNKCLSKYVKYVYNFLERKRIKDYQSRKKVQSLEVYSSSFFIACEGVCAMYNGLRGLRALTDLKSTWILGGVLEKSLNFFNFEWSGAESELIAQSLVFFSFVKQL